MLKSWFFLKCEGYLDNIFHFFNNLTNDNFVVFILDCFNFTFLNVYYLASHDFKLFKMLNFDYFDANASKFWVFYVILHAILYTFDFYKFFYYY